MAAKAAAEPKPKGTKRKAAASTKPTKKAKTAKSDEATPAQEPGPPLELAPPQPWSGYAHNDVTPLKITSWNVNGLRALCKKDAALEYITAEQMDVLCLQEIKCTKSDKDLDKFHNLVKDYHCYWHSAAKKGYSGTMLCSRIEPLSVTYGLGDEPKDEDGKTITFEDELVTDEEGRVITAEFLDFFLVTVYTPNSGSELVRLDYRAKWDKAFQMHCRALDAKKAIIITGDLNCAHNEIDLARPKNNRNKTAGFTDQERRTFTALLTESGPKEGQDDGPFVDTFRHFYPETSAYSYWGYRFNARTKNIGWRLDYFLVGRRILPNICDQTIRSDVVGSDHCPVTLHFSGLKLQ